MIRLRPHTGRWQKPPPGGDPTAELVFIVPFKIFKITDRPVLVAEAVAQAFAWTVLLVAFLRWGEPLISQVVGAFQFCLTPGGLILTIVLGGALAYVIWDEMRGGEG